MWAVSREEAGMHTGFQVDSPERSRKPAPDNALHQAAVVSTVLHFLSLPAKTRGRWAVVYYSDNGCQPPSERSDLL